jgi:hypothetical protein
MANRRILPNLRISKKTLLKMGEPVHQRVIQKANEINEGEQEIAMSITFPTHIAAYQIQHVLEAKSKIALHL